MACFVVIWVLKLVFRFFGPFFEKTFEMRFLVEKWNFQCNQDCACAESQRIVLCTLLTLDGRRGSLLWSSPR